MLMEWLHAIKEVEHAFVRQIIMVRNVGSVQMDILVQPVKVSTTQRCTAGALDFSNTR